MSIVKHSVRVQGRKTSITLEPAFWEVIRDTARARRMTAAALISQIDRERTDGNLSSALRLFALNLYRSGAGPDQRLLEQPVSARVEH